MPNRILRESITTSESVNALSLEAEVFFYRLIVVVDDFGYMDARAPILKARCFPLRDVKPAQIEKWLAELAELDFIQRYEHEGKPYLAIRKWDDYQRVRNQHGKYPAPTDSNSRSIDSGLPTKDGDPRRPAATRSNSPPESNPNPIQSESNPDMSGCRPTSLSAEEPEKPPNPRTQAREILDFLNAKTGRNYQPVPANLDLIAARLKEGATPAQCRQVVAKKSREWSGDEKMAEYLRPATLFNATKFAQYVGELVP